MRNRHNNLFLFLILTFILPLLSIFLKGLIDNSLIQFVLYGVEAASPSIAAFIVLHISKDSKIFWVENIKTKKLMAAIILPVIIVVSTMLLSKTIYCLIAGKTFVLSNISTNQFIIILWALIAEEIGWRGYLQPLLSKQMKRVLLVPFVVGAVWAMWHYHYYLFGMQIPMILFFIGCIVESYIYYYLLIQTENNLVSAMVYHFTWNLGIHLFALNPVDNNGSLLPYTILIILEIVFLIFLLLKVVWQKNNRNPSLSS